MKIRHLRDRHGRGAVTVVSAETGKNKLSFGFAFCSPKDNFSRQVGDAIATERLIMTPLVIDIRGNARETEKFILRLMATRNFTRLNKASLIVPTGFPNLVPGWFKKWTGNLTEKGILCLRACKAGQ